MLIVVLSVWAVWVGLGALALAELFIQDLSMGALLLVTDTPTSVVIVFESVVTFRLVLGAFALAGVVVVVLSVLTCRVGLGALALAGFLVENLSMGAFLLNTLATTCVIIVLVTVVTFWLVLGASALACVVVVDLIIVAGWLVLGTFALAGVVVIDLSILTCWVGLGALTLAGFLVEYLSMRTVLPDTLATTCVWVVLVAVVTLRLILRASALAGIFIVNLTVFASWFGRGALTLAGFLVEDLSVRAPLPCTVTTTSVWIVYVSVTTFRLVFRA